MSEIRWKYFKNRRKAIKSFEYALLRFGPTQTIYWRYVPWLYDRLYQLRYRKYQYPPEPFKIHSVDPKRITRITGRADALLCRASVGAVRGGDWDRKGKSNWYVPDPNSPDETVFSGCWFDDTIFYQSLERRFCDDATWESTELYRVLRRGLNDDKKVLRQCQTETELLDRLNDIDSLYQHIRDDGYKPQSELDGSDSSFNDFGFLGQLTNEVCLDIGRDGELLFADGKHRLAIAKILGLDSIPVVFLTRHKDWMEQRKKIYENEKIVDHPDLV